MYREIKNEKIQLSFIVFILVMLFSSSAAADSAYCTKFGTDNNKPIHEICEEGDIIEVTASQVLHYCDFSKQIITSSLDSEKKACLYIGYIRKFRSRKSGALRPFTIRAN